MPVQQGIMSTYQLTAHNHSGIGQGGNVDPSVINHDALLNFVLAEHLSLPDIIVNVLTDHNKIDHDGLGLDHGLLSGRADDDHAQYYNGVRHTKAVHDALFINAGQVDGVEGAEIIQRDGSVPLTADWDIGVGRRIVVATLGATTGGIVYLGNKVNYLRLVYDTDEIAKILGVSNNIAGLKISDAIISGKAQLTAPTELTINAGVITVTKSYHRIDGQGDLADTLSTINGGADGMILVIQSENAGRDITVDEAGNIMLTGANCILTDPECKLILIYDLTNTKWVELGRCTG